jgi:microsomal epoxide hydrolase
MPEPTGVDPASYTEREKIGLERAQAFKKTGSAYAIEHATFPSTIGFAASSSPLSLLSWIGEKFLRWYVLFVLNTFLQIPFSYQILFANTNPGT